MEEGQIDWGAEVTRSEERKQLMESEAAILAAAQNVLEVAARSCEEGGTIIIHRDSVLGLTRSGSVEEAVLTLRVAGEILDKEQENRIAGASVSEQSAEFAANKLANKPTSETDPTPIENS
ncbi:MAG TPA: hypothetical protein VLE51_02055 [Candidatus Saccharimonadales bacterium]|nr:hypothetical protein [Candidatus Saccharimonadales bacterium]